MQNVITIGKRLVPVEQIALVECFDPTRNPEFKPERPFKGRVVLINRDVILTEISPREFAEAYGFRFLAADDVAVNAAIAYSVETFMPSEAFRPEKPYETRLKWRDLDGNEQSKLLVTSPEVVIAEVLRGEKAPAASTPKRPSPARSRRGARRPATVRG
jgi:hypothetical protein